VSGGYYLVVPYGDNSAATKFLSITTPKSIAASKATGGDNAAIGSATYLYINGTKYTKSANFTDAISTAAYNTSYDWLLNSAGYVTGVVTASSAPVVEEHETGYVYLIKAEEQITTAGGTTTLIGGTTEYSWSIVAKANVAFTNGTTTTVDLRVETTKNTAGEVTGATVGGVTLADAATNQNTPVDITGSGSNMFSGAGWYKYTKYDDGYTLEAVSTSSLALAAGTAVVNSKYATSATVANYYVYNTSTKTVSAKSTTGYANFVDGTYNMVITANNNNIITTIDTFDTTSDNAGVTYAYYVGTGEYDGVSGKTAYQFYVDGEVKNYYDAGTYVSTLSPSAGDIVTLTLDNTGKISAISSVTSTSGKTVTYVDADYSYIKTADTSSGNENAAVVYLAKDCVIYDATTKGAGAVTKTLTARQILSAGVDYNTGDVITYVTATTGANNGKVVAIWITTAGGDYAAN
jgi:hypothetical protein